MQLKYLSNFWRILELPLINCGTNFILTWSVKVVISEGNGARLFAITDTKCYVQAVSLSIHYQTTTTIDIRIQTHN